MMSDTKTKTTTTKQKIREAYQKLQCFDNPTIREIGEDIRQAYHHLYENQDIEDIILEVAEERGLKIAQILNDSRRSDLVLARAEIARRAFSRGFTNKSEIGRALNKDHSTIIHYLEEIAEA